LSKAFDSLRLWENITLRITRAERIGIIGPNGSGKTTLLRVLLGEQDADAGDIKWGANLNIGYYDQRLDDFDPDNAIMDEVREGRDAREKQVRDVLAMMLFRGDDVFKPMGLLSGGERARVRLAQLLLDKPNVLLLDEPTNHLDIASREAVENALREFPGTLLCVSHDRYFLDKVAQRLWVLRPPAVMDFLGNYSAWARKQHEDAARSAALAADQEAAAKKQAKETPRPAAKPTPRKDNPYKRPFGLLSVEQLEKEIEKTEKALKECQSAFADPATFRDPAKGAQLQSEYESLTQKLEQLESEYFLREA
jgi:ATP-binding cassette subfamily F protein 3